MTPQQRVTKAHIEIMKHPCFCLYAGVMLLGKTQVGKFPDVPTACTDGLNVWYSDAFIANLDKKELRSVILHENLHKALRHMYVWKGLFKEHAMLANIAADYVVNQVIKDSDPKGDFARLPADAFQDDKFRNMSVKQVYEFLKKDAKQSGGGKQCLDVHKLPEELSPQQAEEVKRQIEQALREGQILAGRNSASIHRSIMETLTPRVDWRAVLREFCSTIAQGKDTSSWKKINRRFISEDTYLPSLISERVGEIVVAIDTSGSIDAQALAEFATEMCSICENTQPGRVRLLWWDTAVHAEQVFEGEYSGLRDALKPVGGGGTSAECVGKYIKDKGYKPEAVVFMTDGYLPAPPALPCPELWLVTTCKEFNPPGTLVPME